MKIYEGEIFEELVNAGIDLVDFENEDGIITITVHPTDQNKVKDVLEKLIPNVDYEIDEVGMFPKERITLEGEDLETFEKLLTLLEDIEDVSNIYHNVNL